MHSEILNKKQQELLPIMSQFKREYYLVGGTAIAMHIGHRRSIDFDMFKPTYINHKRNLDNLIINDVKVTFFEYPFPIEPSERFENIFRMPSLLQLAAMKAYALGRRSKWKDYVDLYFLLTHHFNIEEISQEAQKIFGQLYSEKMFRSQLCFFEDIDYTEEVEYLIDNPPTEEQIKTALTEIAMQGV